jgi:hypothetical protein
VLALSTATMERLQFFRGDMVLVKGKKRRDTVLIVLADDSVEDSKVRINKGMLEALELFARSFGIGFPTDRLNQPTNLTTALFSSSIF